jgi:pyruvate/2-oxoacid:ferredoxin oxidoreductase alpha subunit
MDKTFEILPRIGADFERQFGRPGLAYFDSTGFAADGSADLTVLTLGPDFGTFEFIREEYGKRTGLKVAGVAMRLLTPFPREAVRKRLERSKVVLVVNQAHHQGRGHLTLDVADALSDLASPPRIVSVFAGLGGADVSESTWELMLEHGRGALEGRTLPPWAFFHEGRAL